MDSGVLVPNWPLPQGVRSALSTRVGGKSVGPFASFNLGDHVGDDPLAVGRNRQHYAQLLGAHPVFMQQVHSWDVALLTAHTLHGVKADACMATMPGLACTVMVADCLPVLLARTDGSAVAAAHAGWRGLAGKDGYGVLEATLEHLWQVVPVSRAYSAIEMGADESDFHASPVVDVMAWLGPCIGPTAFEVGPEVRTAFTHADPAAEACFTPKGEGKFLADLAGLARRRLQDLGVTQVYGNDGSASWCTVNHDLRYFSHRRDHGVSGRFAASIWRT